LIAARASHFRGVLKSVSRDPVKNVFGFEHTEHDVDIINRNRERATRLLENCSFIYKNPLARDQPGTLFRNSTIEEVIKKAFFSEKEQSLAIKKEAHFNDDGGLPLVTIALTTTAIQCAIDEWKTGIRTNCDFTAKAYAKEYRKYLKTLEEWDLYTSTRRKTTLNLRRELLHNGRTHAGVTIEAITEKAAALTIVDFAADEGMLLEGEN